VFLVKVPVLFYKAPTAKELMMAVVALNHRVFVAHAAPALVFVARFPQAQAQVDEWCGVRHVSECECIQRGEKEQSTVVVEVEQTVSQAETETQTNIKSASVCTRF